MPSCSHSNKAGQGGYKNFDEKHFSCLATVNTRESSLNEGALGRIRNHKKRVAQKDHKNFVAVVCLFVFCFCWEETSFSRNTEIHTKYQILTNYQFGVVTGVVVT